MAVLNAFYDNGRYILRNLTDLGELFAPIGNEESYAEPKKRILVFNWRDTKHKFSGGAEVYVHELAKRWVRDGYQVTVFCGNDGHNLRYEVLDGVEVVRRGGFYFVYVWAFLYYIFKFRGLYDVIVDCENAVPFFTPLYASEKTYLLIHHVHTSVFKKSLIWPLARLAEFLESNLMPYVYDDVPIITVSPSSKEEIEAANLTNKPISIIYNGVDLEYFTPEQKDAQPMVMFLGRLKRYKSVDVFIKAAKQILEKVPNAEFVIAGDGDQRAHLSKLAVHLGIGEKIKFLGKVTEEMKRDLYRRSWVFVNTSFMEGWGITTIEANACGTPVVASKVAGLRDAVKNPHTGYLVEYGNETAFAEKITDLLQNEELRNEMSENAKAWAKEFDWNVSAKKALEVLFA
jgi:glycosyltransferase involved in cell wall biosynthesis